MDSGSHDSRHDRAVRDALVAIVRPLMWVRQDVREDALRRAGEFFVYRERVMQQFAGRDPLYDPQRGDVVRSHCGAFTREVTRRWANSVEFLRSTHGEPNGKREELVRDWRMWAHSAKAEVVRVSP